MALIFEVCYLDRSDVYNQYGFFAWRCDGSSRFAPAFPRPGALFAEPLMFLLVKARRSYPASESSAPKFWRYPSSPKQSDTQLVSQPQRASCGFLNCKCEAQIGTAW
ncbi:Protein of unknown function [Gryllus bimaculatus]|nr:Protein of unknown function [Gryllus bimaculatus]